MSRLRRSLIELNSLSEYDYLEPSEQDQLIALLSDISYKQNDKLIRIFALVFFLINPIYLISPSFKKNITGLLCIIIVDLSAANMLWFNQYSILKDKLVKNTLDEDEIPHLDFAGIHLHKNFRKKLERNKDPNRTSLRIKNRLNEQKHKNIFKFISSLNFQIKRIKQLFGQNPKFHMVFQIFLLLASIVIVFQRFKLCFDSDCLFIFLPLFTSITSTVVNLWIKDLVNKITDLNKYKYQKKST